MFDDLLAANRSYQARYVPSGLRGRAAKRLGVLTCIDSRIDPLAVLGLHPGDAKIIRNVGARVTDDVLRSLVLATHLLDVERICVVQHTDCAMVTRTDEELRRSLESSLGVDASEWSFLTMLDQRAALRDDLARIRACELIPSSVELGGFILDLDTAALQPLDQPCP